jgi:hypothetical protein
VQTPSPAAWRFEVQCQSNSVYDHTARSPKSAAGLFSTDDALAAVATGSRAQATMEGVARSKARENDGVQLGIRF